MVLTPEGMRMGSSPRRGSNGRNHARDRPAAGGIRKQVEIMVVEEALQELGAHPRLDTFDFERNASDTRLFPAVPGAVHRSS